MGSKNGGNTLLPCPSPPLTSAYGQRWKQDTGLDGSPVWASTATLMYDEQPLRGLFSEFHAAKDCRNDALADCTGTGCSSWLFTGSAAVQHRGENTVSLHVALQCSLCLRQVSPGSHLRIFPRLQQCCAWSSAKETVNLRVPGSPLIWCRSGKYTTPCTKCPGAQQGRCVMQQCCQSYRPALLTHKMKTIWNLSPSLTMQNSSWLIRAPKDTQGTK